MQFGMQCEMQRDPYTNMIELLFATLIVVWVCGVILQYTIIGVLWKLVCTSWWFSKSNRYMIWWSNKRQIIISLVRVKCNFGCCVGCGVFHRWKWSKRRSSLWLLFKRWNNFALSYDQHVAGLWYDIFTSFYDQISFTSEFVECKNCRSSRAWLCPCLLFL